MVIPAGEERASATALQHTPLAPLDGFSQDEFRARRAALRARCQSGIVLVRGAEEEAHGPFRQDSDFFYLTGVDTPGGYLVLLPDDLSPTAGIRDLGADVREILFLPARDPKGETWTGPKLGPGAETEQATGCSRVMDASGLWGALAGWLRRTPRIFLRTPYGEGAKRTPEYLLMLQVADRAPTVSFEDVSPALDALRAVKSPAEIERIRQAVAITYMGHHAARALIREGAERYEFEVEARILQTFRSQGARLAFPPIVGGGIHGTVLHYEQNSAQMHAGELVVVDIGALYGHYAGDVTRTYPAGGRFSPRQQEVYALVRSAYDNAVSSYRPGEDSLKSMNERCKEFLKAATLRANDSEGIERTMEYFMPHGLGHHLGLAVHDVGEREAPLVPGQVITIEPGLYITSEQIGVRLEDDYLVTAEGLERLGPDYSLRLDATD